MKKLINDVHSVAQEAIEGFALAHPTLVRNYADKGFVGRAQKKEQGKVGIISGGGSGHEPLHAGFVGYGMLDAAIPGAIFTSPTPDPIVHAAQYADAGAGVLFIVKNYTGDVLNFDTAAELAELEGIEVAQLIINDDVAVEDSTFTAGRRGVAGTFLIEKILGAAAERGDSLEEILSLGQHLVKNIGSMGLALSACTVPHVGKASFELSEQEVEYGVGIHGEPGRARIPFDTADHLTHKLIEPIITDLDLTAGEKVITLVNGLGATPLTELYIVHRALAHSLDAANISIAHSLVGNYVTSLDMQGVSITLLRANEEILELFHAPANTPSYKGEYNA